MAAPSPGPQLAVDRQQRARGPGAAGPRALDPLERLWLRLGLLLGAVNNRIILAVVFYGLLTPMGLLLRWRGNDPLRRRFEAAAASYRLPSRDRPGAHMAKPY